MKNFSLDSITIKPKENEAIKKAIILFHGYGGDGSDISMLSHNWKRHLKNTIIICPNGHERCKINPSGFQWFDLSIDDEDYILNQSLNAEIKITGLPPGVIKILSDLIFVLYFLSTNSEIASRNSGIPFDGV